MKTIDFREQIAQAMITLWVHKFRSFLTVLGVVIGTATVIAVGSLITGMQQGVKEQVEQFGTNTALITKFRMGPDHRRRMTEEERKRKPITIEDAQAISQLPSVAAASPILRPSGRPPAVKYRNTEVQTSDVRGVWASFANTRDITIARGRFFTETEDQHKIEVCIVGYNIADKLFSGYDPLGREISIGTKQFRIIGILEKAKASPMMGGPGMNADNWIFIPYEVMHAMYPAQEDHFVTIRAETGQYEKMIDDVTELMRRRRHVPADQPENFAINQPSAMIDTFNSILGVIAMVVIPIVGVALLVGGIGVMNIMLVSVTERTKEIGIRRAIGARRSNIISQFLLEAVTLTGLGGLIGIAFGFFISFLLNKFAPTIPSSVPFYSVALGFTFSVFVGLVFGIYPAFKASRLDPIEALRYE
ncbi:MAG TPA: ABC transporter permease [Blastocatellia bacterium]|nr:ABC transporter permease [Blastocatellia bacterium]